MDGIDANSVFAHLESQRVGQAHQSMLGGRVMAVSRSGFDPGRRTHDDDRATVACFDHRGHSGADGVPRAGEVDVDDRIPLLLDISQSRLQLNTPALATTMSSRPNCATPSATNCCNASGHGCQPHGQHVAAGRFHRTRRLVELVGAPVHAHGNVFALNSGGFAVP